jgi:divalent metal cation (Fe/Co/Zn/Cd) transporter
VGSLQAEPIASIVVSLALIVAASFIAVESIRRIQEPHPLPKPYTLWVLLAVVGVKIVLSRYVTSVGKGLESSAIESDAWHHLSDAITSGFAFVGISVALWIRNPAADDWAALFASPCHHLQCLQEASAPIGRVA